jgi:hypothetical protein
MLKNRKKNLIYLSKLHFKGTLQPKAQFADMIAHILRLHNTYFLTNKFVKNLCSYHYVPCYFSNLINAL